MYLALCGRPQTLGQFLGMGGTATLRQPLDTTLPLKPFRQVFLLHDLLGECPDLLPGLGRA